jgi:hypothetical protein
VVGFDVPFEFDEELEFDPPTFPPPHPRAMINRANPRKMGANRNGLEKEFN